MRTNPVPRYDIPYVNLPAQADEQMPELAAIFERVVRRGSFVGAGAEIERLEARLANTAARARRSRSTPAPTRCFSP
jgi:hypothetical protein